MRNLFRRICKFPFLPKLSVPVVLLLVLARCHSVPDIDFKHLILIDSSGKELNFQSLGSSPALVFFAASWCGSCRTELNLLKKNVAEMAGVRIIVLSDEYPERIKVFRQSGSYPFEFHQLQRPMKALGIYSIPVTYVLDENMHTLKKQSGVIDWADRSTRTHYRKILGIDQESSLVNATKNSF